MRYDLSVSKTYRITVGGTRFGCFIFVRNDISQKMRIFCTQSLNNVLEFRTGRTKRSRYYCTLRMRYSEITGQARVNNRAHISDGL